MDGAMASAPPLFSIRRRIGFDHCDPAGIVFFVEFFRMCNALFEEWFTDGLGLSFSDEFFERDHMFPLVHTEADFSKALRMGDEIEISLVLARLGRSSIDYTCIGRSGGEEVFRIRLVNALGRRSEGRAIEIPPYMRAPMEAYLETGGRTAAPR